ncbi:hypothetical protein F7725_020913 [Dissostichus mawsoni]|uniref:VWFA domain-containing protein n=1 Tax=Dissostichus mawsoni TaxID=36200 RepID=A0A7J5YEM5_DISMA|nr:hypothetical protein F7725_020913 [Dissostichus mawsoni]
MTCNRDFNMTFQQCINSTTVLTAKSKGTMLNETAINRRRPLPAPSLCLKAVVNVYILLDTSGSITKQDFELSRNATIALIRKVCVSQAYLLQQMWLDSYEVQLRFHVLSFATMVKVIVDITNSDISGNIDDVIWNLEGFNYTNRNNLHAALYGVSEKINFLKQNSANNHFNETQNIIIIETDGYSNTGKKPEIALAQIRSLLGYRDETTDNTDETKLGIKI